MTKSILTFEQLKVIDACQPMLCINREFFLAPVANVLAPGVVQALGSVKRLDTIWLFCRYINKIELNWTSAVFLQHVHLGLYGILS